MEQDFYTFEYEGEIYTDAGELIELLREEDKVMAALDYGKSEEYLVIYYFLERDVKTGDTTYCIDDPEEFLLEFYEDLGVEVLQ